MSRRIPLSQLLKAGAIYHYKRWAVDMGGPLRAVNMTAGKPTVFHDIRPSYLYGDKKKADSLLKGHFDYASQTLDVGGQGDPWTVAVPSTRFATWLHGFSWLNHFAVSKDKNAAIRARSLIDKWISVYGKWNHFAWSPDILSDRLFHWLAVWSPLLSGDNLSETAQLRRSSVLRQLKRLRKTYRRTSPGLSRLKAAAVLAMGGARLKDKSDGFLGRGLDWLDDEIELQILPDGGHISRSPAQAVEALEILLTLDSMLESRGVEGSRAMSRAIDRLAPIVPFFTAADGKLVSFNGSGECDLARLATLKKAAPKTTSKPFGYCPHTGYQRIEAEGTVLVVDTGETSPRPFDTQAHLAPLAFELSTQIGRLVVNCGWNARQPLNFRRPVRATAAHSSLTLDKQSAGRLLKEGLGTKYLGEAVAVSACSVSATRKEQVSGTWLETSHDGYREETGLSHRRRFYMSVEGDDIRGEDSLFVPLGAVPLSNAEKPFQISFHFHPDVRVSLSQDQQSALLVQNGKAGWRFRTDGGPLSLEDSVYLGAGHRPVKCQQIIISGHAFCDSDGETRSNRVRWSFRKLEARK
ncbi:heparinase II/III family protein [Hellea balneolensis]|uniref:heparinase II/III family protein n=1 Tax=Hellea balneolensis TaxID=287478 RepID=UPI000415B09A|nr:heparinase II/III family protein [Hellea balneolensis]